MAKKTPYDQLALMPSIVAGTVCGRPYKQIEISEGMRVQSQIDRIEAQRQKMTQESIEAFERHVDALCRAAYDADADWFLKCVNGGTPGRDQLYVWVSHWLCAWLTREYEGKPHPAPGTRI